MGQDDYASRLKTFQSLWTESEATARQLAAIGHFCDSPSSSRCFECGAVTSRESSVQILDESLFSEANRTRTEPVIFHHSSCNRIQVRLPLNSRSMLWGNCGRQRVSDVRNMYERRASRGGQQSTLPSRGSSPPPAVQTSFLLALPTELRLEIYSLVLPALDDVNTIVPLHADSDQIVTLQGFRKAGPRDMTRCNLLSTCRAIYHEALDLLFAHRVFRFEAAKTLYVFLRHIGTAGRRRLRGVDVEGRARETAVAFALLGTCPRLDHLTLRIPKMGGVIVPAPARAPIWLADGVACLLTVRGVHTVRFEPGRVSTPAQYVLDGHGEDAAAIRRELVKPREEWGTSGDGDGAEQGIDARAAEGRQSGE